LARNRRSGVFGNVRATSFASLIRRQGFPQAMPFSQTYPMCCINIRNFVDQFYQFTDGVAQQHLDIDEVLRKVSTCPADTSLTCSSQSLDGLLIDHVSSQIVKRVSGMSNLSQIAQVVVNIEHFATACEELEGVLMSLRWVLILILVCFANMQRIPARWPGHTHVGAILRQSPGTRRTTH
jgi:hypothetical protein